MAHFTFETDLWIQAPIDAVWEFFSRPKNLSELTPSHYKPTIECDENLGTANGARVTIHMSPFGLPFTQTWVSLISGVESTGAHRQFTDTQESGPFRAWKHRHLLNQA